MLSYHAIDYASPDDCALLAQWYNDPELKHLYSRFADAHSARFVFTADHFAHQAKCRPPDHRTDKLMILADGTPIGEASFELDPPKKQTQEPQTGWIALMIGDRSRHQSGLGTQVVRHLETLARNAGAVRIEVGIFAYNTASLAFFAKLGYEEFMRRPDWAWWQGRLWDDVRLLKTFC